MSEALPTIGQTMKIRGRIVTVTNVEPDPANEGNYVVTGKNKAGNLVSAVFAY